MLALPFKPVLKSSKRNFKTFFSPVESTLKSVAKSSELQSIDVLMSRIIKLAYEKVKKIIHDYPVTPLYH